MLINVVSQKLSCLLNDIRLDFYCLITDIHHCMNVAIMLVWESSSYYKGHINGYNTLNAVLVIW